MLLLLLCCHLLHIVWIHLGRGLFLSRLWLYEVVRAFYINSFLVNVVTLVPICIDSYQPLFVFLSFIPVLKLHFDKSEASSPTSCPISHDNGVCDDTEFLEILNQVGFYSQNISY
jgi:hypothetical protein